MHVFLLLVGVAGEAAEGVLRYRVVREFNLRF